jgi:soluble lytic murein transglycosylase-like protein
MQGQRGVPLDPEIGFPGIEQLIDTSSRKYGLPAELINAVIQIESAGDVYAVSKRGAKGLMQLTDSTAMDLGIKDVFDPKQNIDGGSRYLRDLLKRFSGDLKLALAAYNAGPSAVERHGGIPPYSETIRYVNKVLGVIKQSSL